jgi:hypothetical protein
MSQDHQTVLRAIDANLPTTKIFSLVYDYSMLTPILILLGAIVAWIAEEQSRVKIFAMAVAAPALITTWAGGSSDPSRRTMPGPGPSVQWLAPGSAIAQGADDKPTKSAQSLQSIFARDRDHVYAIHVGSFIERPKAEALIRRINTEARTLRAFLSDFTDDKGVLFHRVLVIRLMTLREALALREQILQTRAVEYAAPLEIAGY